MLTGIGAHELQYETINVVWIIKEVQRQTADNIGSQKGLEGDKYRRKIPRFGEDKTNCEVIITCIHICMK